MNKELEKKAKPCIRGLEEVNAKRKWEHEFQTWSDVNNNNNTTPLGSCGEGYICDFCKDPGIDMPCVDAFNEMLKDKKVDFDYMNDDFESIWNDGEL